MRKIKVCHITTVHSPFDVRIFHKECKTLAKAGYQVYLIAQHDREEEIYGIHIIPLPKVKNRFKRMLYLSFIALFKAFKLRSSIYHFHDPELLWVGILLKILTRQKVIYDVHENIRRQILDKEWINIHCRKFLSFIYFLLERFVLHFIDFIVIAEDSYYKSYTNFCNITSVRNYPILEYALKKDFFKERTKNIDVIYVGGISKIRGVWEILEAAKILENKFSFFIIGNISYSLLKEVYQFLNTEKLTNVRFLGEVHHDNIYKYLNRARVGLAILHPRPNYIESYPTKIFEYMLAGLPVIASDFPLWKEMIENNNCGICVDPLNPYEIAEAIKFLMDNPEVAKKMGENGRKAVLEKYNWEKESKKLLDLYEELLK